MRKIILFLTLAIMMNANVCYGFGWDDVISYANDAWDYISGFFSPDNTTPVNEADEILPENIASNWDKLTGNLSDALTQRDKHETLPDSSWLGEDKVSSAKKINALLSRAVEILSDGTAGNTRTQAIKLRSRISSLRAELDRLRNERITAPESTYMFWRSTKSRIDAKISQTEKEISEAEASLSAAISQLTSELEKIGLTLTDTQTEILLNSVTGSDILQNTVIFDNVKSVVAKLEELSRSDTNTIQITRRYAGIYLVLNDLLIYTQEELLSKMENEYRPKLLQIQSEAEKLRKDALSKSNSNVYTPSQRKSFAANARANGSTVEAAKLYGKLLDSQRTGIMNSVKALKLNRDLAENTYRTLRSSGELRALIQSGLKVFDAVNGLTMPELKIFESGTFRQEFDEINRRLKQ